MEKLVGQGSCNGEGEPVPLSHPFEIQVQGHEPREEWQRGPAPGQTGSHRTGPQSSLPRLAPSHPNPPHLAQAYGSQAADPQRSGRSPTLECPISDPLQGSKQRQHPPGERPRSENPHLTIRPICLQGLRRSTHPHGNSGRAIHTM